jgi:DHA1 family multidrug resistance protein-like MFS transporter
MKTNSSLKKFILLLICLFVVMLGYGVLLPVLPYFIEQLNDSSLTPDQVAFHFGILTAIYPITLVFTAPFWGNISDRIGSKFLIFLGLGGFVLMQLMIGFSTTIQMLYFSRIVGSFLSSFLVPVVISNISNITSERDRTKAMAWAGSAVSIGVIFGPALSGLLIDSNLHILILSIHLNLDRFSVPFVVLALVGLITLIATIFIFKTDKKITERKQNRRKVLFPPGKWSQYKELLLLSLIIQFIITSFETVLILQLKSSEEFTLSFIGTSLLICGLVMAIFQPIIAKWGDLFIKGLNKQMFIGFIVSGIVLSLFAFAQSKWLILLAISFFGLGTSFIIPNLLAQVSLKNSSSSGWAFGMQSSFGGIGQMIGPLVGTVVFVLNKTAPFIIIGSISILTALFIMKRSRSKIYTTS